MIGDLTHAISRNFDVPIEEAGLAPWRVRESGPATLLMSPAHGAFPGERGKVHERLAAGEKSDVFSGGSSSSSLSPPARPDRAEFCVEDAPGLGLVAVRY